MSDFDLQGLAQVSVSTDIPAHRRIVDGAIFEITTLRQQLADVTGCTCNSEGPCKYHAMTSVSGRSYVLRKQAEAVEAAKHEHALTARIPDGTAGEHFQDGFDAAAEQYDASLDRYAQRLRQQADEAELAGGVE